MGSGGSKDGKESYLLETLEEHKESINVVALSEDGSLLVTGSEDGTARMWSTKTSKTESLGALEGHTSYILCITVNDTYIITGAEDQEIRKWDMTTCECLFVYRGHTSQVNRVICTGEFIFSTSSDKTAKAWIFDAENLDEEELDTVCVRTFKDHAKSVIPLIFIPAENTNGLNEEGQNINPGDILITGSQDFTAKSWSFDTGACIKTFKGHRGPVTCMATDPQGRMLYTGSQDMDIKCWNIATGECRKTLSGHSGGLMCLTVVNKLMYSAATDGRAFGWVREFGDLTREYKGHNHTVTGIKFHEGILYTGCSDGIGRAYDAKSGLIKREFKAMETTINSLAVCGKKLYTAHGGSPGVLRVWNVEGLSEEVANTDEEYADTQAYNDCSDKQLDALDRRLDGYLEPDKESKLIAPPRARSPEMDDEMAMLEKELDI